MIIKILCVLIGTQFFLSALTKIRGFKTFISILNSYQVPNVLKTKNVAILIIGFESFLSLFLLSLNKIMVFLGLWGALIFMLFATMIIFIRWLNGEKKFRCGCGDNLEKKSNATWLLIRNLILMSLIVGGLFNLNSIGSFWSKDILYIYLSGWGLLAILQLCGATLRAIQYIKEWKTVG